MAYCQECGNSLEPRVRFCDQCGMPIPKRPGLPLLAGVVALVLLGGIAAAVLAAGRGSFPGSGASLSRSRAAALISAHLKDNPTEAARQLFFFAQPNDYRLLPRELVVHFAPPFSAGCYVSFWRSDWSEYLSLQQAGLIEELWVVEPDYDKGGYLKVVYSQRVGSGALRSIDGSPVVLSFRYTGAGSPDRGSYFLLTEQSATYIHSGKPNSTSVTVLTATVKRVSVTGIVLLGGIGQVEATVEYQLTPFGRILTPWLATQNLSFNLVLYDDGWRVMSVAER